MSQLMNFMNVRNTLEEIAGIQHGGPSRLTSVLRHKLANFFLLIFLNKQFRY